MRSLLLALSLLTSSASWACLCESIASMPDAKASSIAMQEVGSADEILRVRVLNLTRIDGNTTTFIVQVHESLKSGSSENFRKVATGPDSCALSMRLNEEWLLFVRKGRVSQCSGSWFLGTTAENLKGLSTSQAVDMYEHEHAMATRWVSLVRGVLEGRVGR
jgi:hypothetical protein